MFWKLIVNTSIVNIKAFLQSFSLRRFVATTLNVQSMWYIGHSVYSTSLEVDAVAPVNIDYLPTENCLDRDCHFLIPIRGDWGPNTVVQPERLDIYTNGSKLNNGVGCGIYSGKLDLSIFLRLSDYCSVFQEEAMATTVVPYSRFGLF